MWRSRFNIFHYVNFSGLPEKNPVDHFEQGSFCSGRGAEQLKSLLTKFDQIEVFEGNFNDTVPVSGIEKLALAHIDCDQYSPTKFLSEYLYDKMTPGGITYGERIAVDSIF